MLVLLFSCYYFTYFLNYGKYENNPFNQDFLSYFLLFKSGLTKSVITSLELWFGSSEQMTKVPTVIKSVQSI